MVEAEKNEGSEIQVPTLTIPESGQNDVEKLMASVETKLEFLWELCELGAIQSGEGWEFAQLLDDPDDWEALAPDQRGEFLNAMGNVLGVGLPNIRDEEVMERKFQEGTAGARSEKGANVTILKLENFPELQVHISKYNDPKVGTRYDLVKK